MGQRLNIEIVKNGKILANSYYHWDGYSDCSINHAVKIIQDFNYIKRCKVESYIENQDLLFAIRLLEDTGAGFDYIEKSRKFLKDSTNHLKLAKCVGRNEGIIAIEEKDIEETRRWEEGRLTIDIEKKTVNFNVLHKYTKEQLKESFDEDEIKELKIKEINMNFENVPFEEIFDLKAFIDKANYSEQYYFFNKYNNEYVFLIQ